MVKAEGHGVNFSYAKREIAILAGILFLSFIIRLLLFSQPGFPSDIADFIYWFNTAAVHGIRPFYAVVPSWTDYPPFNVYIFWAAGKLVEAVSAYGISAVDIVKLVPSLFDMATGLLIYVFVRRQASFKLAIFAAALYVFNPAVIFDSAVWGQIDAMYTFFLLLALMLALKSRPILASATYAIAILTKPQSIALLPVLAVLIYKKSGLKNLIYSIGIFVATIYVVDSPFQYLNAANVVQNAWSNPLGFLNRVFVTAYSGYKVTSANAFNLWAIWPGLWVSDANFFILGWILFGALAAFVCYLLYKRLNDAGDFFAIFCAFMLFFAFFMLPTRIHERYMFPAVAALALLVPFVRRTRPLYAVLTATLLVNEATILYYFIKYPDGVNLTGTPIVLAVSAVNLVMLAYAVAVMWTRRTWLRTEPPPPPPLNETESSGTQSTPELDKH